MIRRDAKLGFIISGILVAVIIVYVLVPGKKATPGVPLDEGTKIDQAAVPDANPSIDPAKPADSSAGALSANVPAPTPAPTGAAVATATDPFSANTAEQPRGTDEDKWMLALNHGSVPPAMMSSAPQLPTHGADLTKKTKSPESAAIKASANSTPAITPPVDSISATPTPIVADVPATQPASAGKMNTHVVQSGETLSSIAKVAYGSANFYPYISRANPGIVDKALRPGMTINLPSEADVKSGASAASKTQGGGVATAAGSDVKIDPTTEYQVGPGDSLAKIAMKLYGASSKWQQIYDLNKETIGNDPQKLKLKTILKLPEPPTMKS